MGRLLYVAKRKLGCNAEAEVAPISPRRSSIPDLIQQILVTRYAPAAVLVNNRGEVVYIHGHTGVYPSNSTNSVSCRH